MTLDIVLNHLDLIELYRSKYFVPFLLFKLWLELLLFDDTLHWWFGDKKIDTRFWLRDLVFEEVSVLWILHIVHVLDGTLEFLTN